MVNQFAWLCFYNVIASYGKEATTPFSKAATLDYTGLPHTQIRKVICLKLSKLVDGCIDQA